MGGNGSVSDEGVVLVEGRVDRYDLAVEENVVGGDRRGVGVSGNGGELEVIANVNVVVLFVYAAM